MSEPASRALPPGGSPRKRVLVAHPAVGASGGGNGLAAWALQALRDEFDVSLLSLQAPDLPAVNRTFGTSLRAGDFRVYRPGPASRLLVSAFPRNSALLRLCVVMRAVQDLDARERFDVLLGTHNEADFGRRGIHYVNHPWVYLPLPAKGIPGFRHVPGIIGAYRRFCRAIARSSNEGLRRNLFISNSGFVAAWVSEVHGVESVVVYPPVVGTGADVPWEERVNGFVAVGRLHASKRWDMAVAILDAVRQRGHDVSFTLIGSLDDDSWRKRLQALSATRPWMRLLFDVSRVDLAREMSRHRYGIHTMHGEHFGMAPAEIQRAGAIVFVHNSGGPVEIVGGDPRLLFEGVEDAADRIARVLASPEDQASLRALGAVQRERFSAERFSASMRDVVRAFPSRLEA